MNNLTRVKRQRRRLHISTLMLMFVAMAAVLGSSKAQAPSTISPQSLSNNGFATGPSEQIAHPGVGPIFSAPFASSHLFGDWGGARTWLLDHGVNVNVDILNEAAGNVSGGLKKGFRNAGQVGVEADFDLQKLLSIPGASFHTMIVNGYGRNLSGDTIGDDLANVQEIYGGRGNVVAHLVYAYGEKEFLDNRLSVVAGWLPVGTFFAASPFYCNYLSVVICNPETMFRYPSGTEWPFGSLGGLVRYTPTSNLYAMVGLFSTDTDAGGVGGGGISGWAWADPHKSGVSVPMELGYVSDIGRDHLDGHYKVGFSIDTHHYADVEQPLYPPGVTRGGTRSREYITLDQMIVRQGPGDETGLVVLGGWFHSTDSVSPFTQQVYAGLRTTGIPWGRPKDSVSFLWQWFEMSGGFTRAQEALAFASGGSDQPISVDGYGPAYGPQNSEHVVELNYALPIYRGVTAVPDFQYVIRPGATTKIPNAAVLGFRFNINL